MERPPDEAYRAQERAPLDTTIAIEVPEHIRFEVRAAGPVVRLGAYTIDLLLRALIALVVLLPLLLLQAAPEAWNDASIGVTLLILFALEWGYYVVAESIGSGQSPGKRILGLRVIDERGRPASFSAIVLRNLLRAADALPLTYAVAAVVMAGDRRFRRLGDLVAGTIVVVEVRARAAAAVRIDPPPRDDELAALPSDVGLSGADLDAIEALLRRLPTLGRARAQELAEILAPSIAARLGLAGGDPVRQLALVYHRARAGIDAARVHGLGSGGGRAA